MPTHCAEAARRAHDVIAAVEAVARHAFVAEREIEFHGVGGIDGGQARGDLLGHLPVPRPAAGEADGPAHVLDVRVHRYQQARR